MTGPDRRRGERGATSTEYAVLAGFIAIAIAFGLTAFGLALDGMFQALGGKVAAIFVAALP